MGVFFLKHGVYTVRIQMSLVEFKLTSCLMELLPVQWISMDKRK